MLALISLSSVDTSPFHHLLDLGSVLLRIWQSAIEPKWQEHQHHRPAMVLTRLLMMVDRRNQLVNPQSATPSDRNDQTGRPVAKASKIGAMLI
jgi:hypothetical protein